MISLFFCAALAGVRQSLPLPSGSKIALISVSNDPLRRAWRADGSSAKPVPQEYGWPISEANKGDLAFLFRVDLSSASPGAGPGEEDLWPSVEIYQPPTGKPAGPDLRLHAQPHMLGPRSWAFIRYGPAPPGAKSMDLAVSVASGAWKTASRAEFHRGTRASGGTFIGSAMVLTTPRRKYTVFPQHVPASVQAQYEFRLVALGPKRTELPPPGIIRMSSGTYDLFETPAEQITEIKLETRPLTIMHFRNVATRPKG